MLKTNISGTFCSQLLYMYTQTSIQRTSLSDPFCSLYRIIHCIKFNMLSKSSRARFCSLNRDNYLYRGSLYGDLSVLREENLDELTYSHFPSSFSPKPPLGYRKCQSINKAFSIFVGCSRWQDPRSKGHQIYFSVKLRHS